jgi:hypothetical protein
VFIRLYQLLFLCGILFASGGLVLFALENYVNVCNKVVLCHHYAVGQLLGTALPSQITNLNYFKWEPTPDLYFYETYIKFGASREEFIQLIERMNMDFYRSDKNYMRYLPTNWKATPQIKLDWWNPKITTPFDDAAAGSFGLNGSIIAKYEGCNIYIMVTDHGNALPGPY